MSVMDIGAALESVRVRMRKAAEEMKALSTVVDSESKKVEDRLRNVRESAESAASAVHGITNGQSSEMATLASDIESQIGR